MTEEDILLDAAVLGEQVNQFFKSDIGKFLSNRIDGEVEDALKVLRTVDCTDASKVFSAQAAVWRAETLRSWLEEAILAGLKAQLILDNRDE